MKYLNNFNDFSKNNESILDKISDELSEIFEDGKIKKEVKLNIIDGINIIKQEFPNLNIDKILVVGASVTYQYSETSDIDITVFVDKSIPDDLFKSVDKWIESNLDTKYKYNKRKYQFKLSKDSTKEQLDKVDSAYDITNDIWIKKLDLEKTKNIYNKKINKDSKESKLYREMEKSIKRTLKELYDAIDNKKDDILSYVKNAYKRYELIIKKYRRLTYDKQLDPDDISKNWGRGNIIYKMFDKEGYNSLFSDLKSIIKNNNLANLYDLKNDLKVLIDDEVGYVVENVDIFDDNILFLDVESTCYEILSDENISEVIEIGLCDLNGKLFEPILIKPQYSEVTDYCTELTSITKYQIEKEGVSPNEAYKLLNDIFSKYNTWASYGEYDKIILTKMCKLYNININFPKHINVRKLFSQNVMNSQNPKDSPINPKDSLELIGHEFVGKNHRANDDAINIAKLYRMMPKRDS